MRIGYFVNDLSDASAARRVRMLRVAGADVELVGFRRTMKLVTGVEGITPIDLGRTFEGRLGNRLIQVLRQSCRVAKWKTIVSQSDVLLARNLEMATIAEAARGWAGVSVPLVYECLDIHSSQLGNGASSKLLRLWEKQILRRSAALIISSQSHITNYFDQLGVRLPKVILAENKLLPEGPVDRPQCISERRPPWRIGWFGNLRCAESFGILMGLAQRHPKLVDIDLRGRPAAKVQALIMQHLPLANMRFEGPYCRKDLPTIYAACDFTWAVEYAGQNATNAKWALGNRLYEGGFYNSPAIVIAGTAMGDWLRARQAGVIMTDPRRELDAYLTGLTSERYQTLRRSAAQIPTNDLVWAVDSCERFVAQIMAR